MHLSKDTYRHNDLTSFLFQNCMKSDYRLYRLFTLGRAVTSIPILSYANKDLLNGKQSLQSVVFVINESDFNEV